MLEAHPGRGIRVFHDLTRVKLTLVYCSDVADATGDVRGVRHRPHGSIDCPPICIPPTDREAPEHREIHSPPGRRGPHPLATLVAGLVAGLAVYARGIEWSVLATYGLSPAGFTVADWILVVRHSYDDADPSRDPDRPDPGPLILSFNARSQPWVQKLAWSLAVVIAISARGHWRHPLHPDAPGPADHLHRHAHRVQPAHLGRTLKACWVPPRPSNSG